MITITITGKKRWEDGGLVFMECFCNEQRIFGKCKPRDEETLIESMKNTCKGIKYTGEPVEKFAFRHDLSKNIDETPLPEWQ